MISYDPLWKTMKEKGVSTYKLINHYKFSGSTVHRLKHNGSVTTTTLSDLCEILDCKIEDIIKYKKS